MAQVVIAGIGQTPVGEHWDMSLRELALDAIEAVQLDSRGLQPQALYVGNMVSAGLSRQAHLGALIADFAGLTGIEAFTVEAAGASGGAALRAGYLAVASGQVDVAMALGIEKFTDRIGATVEESLAAVADSDYESAQGLTPTAQAALVMRRYMYEFDVPHEAFAGFPLTAHANGAGNPYAMFQKAIKAETYNRAGIVSDPLNLFDVAPNADGAAGVILTRPEMLPPGYPHRLVCVSGSSVTTDTLPLHDRPDTLIFRAARLSVERACRQAGITIDQIDFFELSDTFSIFAALALESAGFAERGEGWRFAQDGKISLNSQLPISTMGGYKARGNPGGASGVYQVVESVEQLRGQAGANQIPNVRYGLVQCLGGPASTAATHVLEVFE